MCEFDKLGLQTNRSPIMLGLGVWAVARRRRAAREASNSVQQLEALKELSLKLNPQSSNPEL